MKPLYTILSLLCIVTTGCDELGVKTTPYIYDTGNGDTTVPLEDFVVTDIDPNFGSPSGGTSVLISGNGFEGEVSVHFGNMNVDITVVDEQTILLTTPSSPSEGQVNVTVESDLGSVTLDDGFTYTFDAPEDIDTQDTEDTQDTQDTQDTTDTGNTTGTGQTGGLVELWRKLYTCPNCFQPPMAQQTVEAAVTIHTPTTGSWLSWLPPMNSCITQVANVSLGTSETLGQVALTATDNNGLPININLTYNGQYNAYTNLFVPTDSFEYNTVYGLQSDSVNFNAILQTPSVFTSIEPEDIMDAQGFTQPFSRHSFAVLWGPSGTGDTIVFQLDGANGTPQNPKQVLCMTTDSGGLQVDPNLLANFSPYELLSLSLYRVQLTGAIHPDNGSTIEAISAIGIIGTGILID